MSLLMLCFYLASFWKRLLLLCLIFSALLLLTSCGQNATASQSTAQTGGVSAQGCNIEVSWAMGYASLNGLKQATSLDLAVQGSFTKILSAAGQANPSSGQNGPPTTNFAFAVSKVLLNPHHLLKSTSSSITIHQTGVRVGNTLHQVCGDPLFRVGEGAILFLHQFSPDQYMVIGGPSGRFEVRSDLVQPVNDEGVKLPAGLTEQQFYALLQKA